MIGDETTKQPGIDDMPSLEPGTVLGVYRIIKEHGRGGMGVVYLAEHIYLKKTFALKLLPQTLSSRGDFANRFYRDASVMEKLEHPNIVRVHDMTVQNNIFFLVTELVGSEAESSINLDDYLEMKGGKLSPEETADIIRQVCKGLGYIHAYRSMFVEDGIVHRDLKPSNILLGKLKEDGFFTVKISDSGLAKTLGWDYIMSSIKAGLTQGAGRQITQSDRVRYRSSSAGSILRTYEFMSPEQLEPEFVNKVDRRSDIYSLGILIYLLLTARMPRGDFQLPSEIDSNIPAVWDYIVEKCLRVEPSERFGHCHEIEERIGSVSIEGYPPVLRSEDLEITPLSRAEEIIEPSAETFKNSIGMEFVYIKPGTFIMGSPKHEKGRYRDEFQHEVTISRGFFLATTAVTQEQWRRITGTLPWQRKISWSHWIFSRDDINDGDTFPANYVSWFDAVDFIQKLNNYEKTKSYRLPTEAEWEYACRAGSNSTYYWGDAIDPGYCWYIENAWMYEKKHPPGVAGKAPNPWGLYDMSGLVLEWCQDFYAKYRHSAVQDPAGPGESDYKVLRGGSWVSEWRNCRSAYRRWYFPEYSADYVGFRVVCTLE